MKKLLLSIVSVFAGFLMMATPVYADCVRTSVLGHSVCDKDNKEVSTGETADGVNYFNCSCDGEGGERVINIVNTVINIMTVGVGILGVVGISVVGVQYLTAGGSEEKTRKAKRRMLEIVIGLVAYVLIYAILKWLMPYFHGSGG